MAYDQNLADAERAARTAEHLPAAIEVPLWVFLGMLVTEMRKHSESPNEILELANRVQEIANAIRKE